MSWTYDERMFKTQCIIKYNVTEINTSYSGYNSNEDENITANISTSILFAMKKINIKNLSNKWWYHRMFPKKN